MYCNVYKNFSLTSAHVLKLNELKNLKKKSAVFDYNCVRCQNDNNIKVYTAFMEFIFNFYCTLHNNIVFK